MIFEFGGGNKMVEVITPDGRVGFDKHGQLWAWTERDDEGYSSGSIIRDVRDSTCYICGQGWELTADRLADQFMIDGRLIHRTCGYGHQKMDAYRDVQHACIDAGYLFNMEEVPPRYPHSTPWQRITVLGNDKDRTDTGFRIVLGRRKRVWEVRGHRLGDLTEVFRDVGDTKGYSQDSEEDPDFGPYYYVHAWTKLQLVDYLTRFRQAIPASTDRKTAAA